MIDNQTVRTSARLKRLHGHDRTAALGLSVKEADRFVCRTGLDGVMDTTHFDTVRFSPPPWAAQAFADAATDGALAYTPYRGHGRVLARVARALSTYLDVAVDPVRHLILTPGTQAGLFAALSAIVDPGTRVLLPQPEYLFDDRILGFLDAEIIEIDLEIGPGPPRLDLAALEAESAAGPAVLLFSHPNNPTGAVYPPETIAAIAEIAVAHDLTVIVDELYARLLHDGAAFSHLLAQPGMSERCVTLLGPSKTESLSGYRLGVAVGPALVIDAMEDVQSVTSLRAPAYAQHVLHGWLSDDGAWLGERLAEFTALRALTTRRLSELPWVTVHPQAGTAYLFPDLSALGVADHLVAERLVREARVLVSPGYQFGRRGMGSMRLCYARDATAWDAALTAMVDVLGVMADERGL